MSNLTNFALAFYTRQIQNLHKLADKVLFLQDNY